MIVVGYRLFEGWQEKRFVRHAEKYLEMGDLKSATIMARHVLEIDSTNVQACRILARVFERVGQPAAVDWRMKALAMVPNSVDDAIALAKTALQFNEIATAERGLASVEARGQDSAAYHEAEAQLAIAKKDSAAAEKHFAEAARLDPSNKSYQLNVAVFKLQSNSADARSSASALLQQFMDDKDLRVPAARALRDYAAQRKDAPAILEISRLLYSYPEATFRDRIFCAQVLHALDQPEFAAKLTDLQNEAATDSGKVTELLSWMCSNRLALLAIHWVKELPPEITSKRPAPVAVADCYLAASDWDGLQQWCRKEDWDDLEFLRHAYLARVLRERGDNSGFQSEWSAALQKAGADGERLYTLEQGAVKWGWKEQAEDLLWMLGKDLQKQNDALAALYQYYATKGATGDLYRVVARFCEIKPNDEKAQNNFAQLSLLLNVNLEHAHEVAEQLYKKNPQNPIFVSTYGFSLYRQGRYAQALKAMNELGTAELQKPGTAAYYGLFLAAAGDKGEAAEYLEMGAAAPLLPEERALLQSARDKIKGDRP